MARIDIWPVVHDERVELATVSFTKSSTTALLELIEETPAAGTLADADALYGTSILERLALDRM